MNCWVEARIAFEDEVYLPESRNARRISNLTVDCRLEHTTFFFCHLSWNLEILRYDQKFQSGILLQPRCVTDLAASFDVIRPLQSPLQVLSHRICHTALH